MATKDLFLLGGMALIAYMLSKKTEVTTEYTPIPFVSAPTPTPTPTPTKNIKIVRDARAPTPNYPISTITPTKSVLFVGGTPTNKSDVINKLIDLKAPFVPLPTFKISEPKDNFYGYNPTNDFRGGF
jgi:hypothetical protein